jgi:hypothetical protein
MLHDLPKTSKRLLNKHATRPLFFLAAVPYSNSNTCVYKPVHVDLLKHARVYLVLSRHRSDKKDLPPVHLLTYTCFPIPNSAFCT